MRAYQGDSIVPFLGAREGLLKNFEKFILDEALEPYTIRALNQKHQWVPNPSHSYLIQATTKMATKDNDPGRTKLLIEGKQ